MTLPISTTVTGTVQVSERKFESNLSRLLTQKEGESKAKMIAIAVVGFIPALLSDAVRALLFQANLINGKSFSLIDHASAGAKTLSNKVSATWESYKNPPLTVQNERSKAVLKAKAKDLVNAYISIDRNCLRQTRDSFSNLGAQAIKKGQSNLLSAIEAHLKLNVDSSASADSFGLQLASVKALVEKFISDAAGDEVYIKNKTVRKVNKILPSLASVIKAELHIQLEAVKGLQFAAVSKTPTFVATLAKQVAETKLTQPQAEQALKKHLSNVHSHALPIIGLNAANSAVNKMVGDAVEKKLIAETDAKELAVTSAQGASTDALALGVALDSIKVLASSKPASTAESDYITITADVLIDSKHLKAEDKSIFCTATRDELAKIRKNIAAQEKAYTKLNQFAKGQIAAREAAEQAAIDAKIAEEKAAADEAALVAKAKELSAKKQSLFDKFKELLGIVSKAQGSFAEKAAAYVAKDVEFQAANGKLTTLLNTEVTMSKGSMKLLQATEFYYSEEAKLNGQRMNPIERTEKLNALVNNDDKTIALIKELQPAQQKTRQLNSELGNLFKDIKEKDATFARLFNIYKTFEKSSIATLDKADRIAIAQTEKKIVSDKTGSEDSLPKELKDLFGKKHSLTAEELAGLAKIVDQVIAENKPVVVATSAPVVVDAPKPQPSMWRGFVDFATHMKGGSL